MAPDPNPEESRAPAESGTLWAGRLDAEPAEALMAFTVSLPYDRLLAADDIAASHAHVRGLVRAGLLSEADGVAVAGCAVADDFDHAFGDTREARLNAPLGYRSDSSCPEPPATGGNTVLATVDSLESGLLRSKMHGLTIPQDVVAPAG